MICRTKLCTKDQRVHSDVLILKPIFDKKNNDFEEWTITDDDEMGDEEEDHCGGGGDDDYDAKNDKGDRHKDKDNEDGYVVDCYNDVEYETSKICHLTAKQTLFLLQLQYILHVFGNWITAFVACLHNWFFSPNKMYWCTHTNVIQQI